jgi:hypothetical protein
MNEVDRVCKFYKEENGSWFIALPEWSGDKSALQMVLGADYMLDIMAQGQKEILVRFSTEGFPGSSPIIRQCLGFPGDADMGDTDMGGATYYLESYNGTTYKLDLWLCDVTHFVFGEFPGIIYINCLS